MVSIEDDAGDDPHQMTGIHVAVFSNTNGEYVSAARPHVFVKARMEVDGSGAGWGSQNHCAGSGLFSARPPESCTPELRGAEPRRAGRVGQKKIIHQPVDEQAQNPHHAGGVS